MAAEEETLSRCHDCGSTNLEMDYLLPGSACPQTGYQDDPGVEVKCLDCGAEYIVEGA